MIKFINTPRVTGNKIVSSPIYVRSDIDLPVVGELVKATSDDSKVVLVGEVIEVSESRRTYVARFSGLNWDGSTEIKRRLQ